MSHRYTVEYTDTFGGEANYSWVNRATITMPELTDGAASYSKAIHIHDRELMKHAKAKMGLTNVRGRTSKYGDTIEFRPYRSCNVMFITYSDE